MKSAFFCAYIYLDETKVLSQVVYEKSAFFFVGETCVHLHKLAKFNNFPRTKRLKRICCFCQLVTDLFLLRELTAVQEKTAER